MSAAPDIRITDGCAAAIAAVLIATVLCITAYSIADRLGPARPDAEKKGGAP